VNHASIIDGIRLSKAQRFRYRNGDMQDLERSFKNLKERGNVVIATDGVFSMNGYIAKLPEIRDLAEQYGAFARFNLRQQSLTSKAQKFACEGTRFDRGRIHGLSGSSNRFGGPT
jgi:hypothetical protein